MLIHGWAADHTYMAPLLDRFSLSHRVVAMDLLGHGQSDRPRGAYTVERLADDVGWMCAELGLDRPALVGHGMGGVIALELGNCSPQLVRAVVAVDIPAPLWHGPVRAIPELPRVMRTRASRETLSEFGQPSSTASEALADQPGVMDVLAAAWNSMWSYDLAAALASCSVPVLHIAARQPPPNLPGFQLQRQQLKAFQTLGARRPTPAEVADQVVARVERLLSAVAMMADPRLTLSSVEYMLTTLSFACIMGHHAGTRDDHDGRQPASAAGPRTHLPTCQQSPRATYTASRA